jgi:membrane associated rhomboid family serine protease
VIPLRDTIPHRRTPYVTWTLIAVNLVVFLYELSLGPDQLEALFYMFGIAPARYTHPEWARQIGLPVDDYWPFLTSMFLHGGWAHVIGNMWALWIFGDNVEDRMGPGRFLSQVLGGALAGLSSSQVGGIAFWAHVGGFVAGMVLHRLFILPERDRPRPFERDEYGIEGAWANRP